MTAGELALVVAVVLCVLAFAALAVTLVRVRDTLGSLRTEVAERMDARGHDRMTSDDGG